MAERFMWSALFSMMMPPHFVVVDHTNHVQGFVDDPGIQNGPTVPDASDHGGSWYDGDGSAEAGAGSDAGGNWWGDNGGTSNDAGGGNWWGGVDSGGGGFDGGVRRRWRLRRRRLVNHRLMAGTRWSIRRTLVRNTVTSLVTSAIDFLVLTGLVELFSVHYLVATIAGTVAGASSNFLINRQWTFDDHRGRLHWQLARFLPVQAGSSLLQTLGMWLFVGALGIEYIAAKLVVAVSVYLFWNYPMNRFFVFPSRSAAEDGQ